MSYSPVQTPAARKAASSQQATLDALAGIADTYVKEQLSAMTGRMAAALGDLTRHAGDPQDVQRRVKAARLLKDNAYAFFHLASGAIGLAVRRELDRLVPRAAPARMAASLDLVPLEEIDSRLALGALARPFDIRYADPLAMLAVRLGMLLGRGVLRADSNPFRPEVFLGAIDEAWREFEPETDAHGLILALLRPDIVFDFAPLCDALVAALRKEGQPGSVDAFRIQKTDDTAAAKAARAGQRAVLAERLRKLFGDDGGEDGVPLIPDLPTMPSSGGWRPSAAGTFAAAPVKEQAAQPAAGFAAPSGTAARSAAGFGSGGGQGGGQAGWPAALQGMLAQSGGTAPLLDLLARIEPVLAQGEATAAATPHNVFYLPRLKQSLPQGSLPHRDERTLDLLSRVFETVLLDDSIPPRTRELLQLLQVPVLKAALLDKSFFFEQDHPARRLVDLMSSVGWEQREDADDPLFQTMRRSVARVGEAQPEAFASAVAELEAGIAADESAREAALAAPVATALKREQHEVAARRARDAVELRLQAGDVGDVVGGFLEQRWTTVLTFAWTIDDARPGAVDNATRAMDDLIWSVKPKATPEQRKALIARLPRLLQALNKWLDAIKWQDAERLQFFARLAEYHAAIVRAPIELSPERQLELAAQAARQDALRKVEMENAAAAQAAARAAEVSAVDGLERGMWLEFRVDDRAANRGTRKVKLAWVSPLRTLFIFSGAGRREAFSLPADKLVAALGDGSARVLAIDGVVGQVLSDAMAQGAVNDPAIAIAMT